MTIEQKKVFTAFRLATGKSYDPTSKLDQKSYSGICLYSSLLASL